MKLPNQQFKQSLKLFDAVMIVSGSMIGSGIFIVSSDILQNVGSAGWFIFVWIITGVMTMIAAVSYGELSAMFPKAGGQYVYLKEAYNKLIGFLYGWSLFAVIQTATIAAVGVAFSRYLAYLVPSLSETNILFQLGNFKISAAQLTAIALILLLTYTNTRGIKQGKIIQTIFTSTKLVALFGLIILGFVVVKNNFWIENWQSAFSSSHFVTEKNGIQNISSWLPISGSALVGAIAAAMVGSIFSSDAWNNVTFIAAEIKNPKKNIGLSLLLGTLIVTLIYIAANLMYLYVLPLHSIAFPEGERVAVAAASNIFGDVGSLIIALLIVVSTFGCNNGLILSGARVYYTMAKDGIFFKQINKLNKHAVPANALWLQAIVASILSVSGKYGDLLDMIAFVVVVFYAITIFGIFILRKKNPNAERPYKAFGYPVLPAIYILLAMVFCFFLIKTKPDYAIAGLCIVLVGIPLYFVSRKK